MIRVKIANQQEFVPLDWAKLREIGTAVLEGEGIKDAKVTVDNALIAASPEHSRRRDFGAFQRGSPPRCGGELWMRVAGCPPMSAAVGVG